jgi:hypothetical protein
MLPGLQFTDFHKFLVSVGGLSLAASVSLPALLLRSQNVILIPEKQLGELSKPAASAIRLQQDQTLFMLKYWPILSIVLAFGGVVLIVTGATIWRERQELLNKRDASELAKSDAERRKLDEEANALVRANKENDEENARAITQEAAMEDPQNSIIDAADPRIPEQRREASTEKAEDPEELLQNSIRRLREALSIFDTDSQLGSPRYARGVISHTLAQEQAALFAYRLFKGQCEIVKGVRTGLYSRADFIVTSRVKELPNLIVKVTRLSEVNKNQTLRTMRNLEDWAQRTPADANNLFNVHYRPMIFLVHDGKFYERSREVLELAIETMKQLHATAGAPPATFIVTSQDALDGPPPTGLIQLTSPTAEIVQLNPASEVGYRF